MLDGQDLRRRVREGSEEEQGFVEADELMRIEWEVGELGEKFGDDRGMIGVEAAFGYFQLGEELLGIVLLGIVGSGGHGREIV